MRLCAKLVFYNQWMATLIAANDCLHGSGTLPDLHVQDLLAIYECVGLCGCVDRKTRKLVTPGGLVEPENTQELDSQVK